ncbi:two-component sensor histidine kinase [Aliifodinibius salipaludis]|uniref:histidine kinase n=1 Tax=Fodinibius salipaludis TaxID=2032627 RepID=A0A2A2GBZ4_9BACT|nr:ATP-binding protein [Aliifodinibius salipaludis]PAU95081.1 two-component sensor histidine kinase [Aliifodinibius salipaludis]
MNKIVSSLTSFFDRLSISKKLAFWYGLSLFVMLSLFGYFLYESFHQSIHHNYDRHLRFEAEQLLPHIDTDGDTLAIDLSEYSRSAALKSGVEYGTYVRLYDREGHLMYKSPNFTDTDQPLETDIPDVEEEYSFSSQWQDLPARTLFYPIMDDNEKLNGWLEVTGFEWTLHDELSRFRRYLLFLIAISVAFSILGGYWLSRRALSPVSSIIDAAKSITTTDLDKRIPVNYQVRDELTDLAETFNMMLNRLQKGFEREKRFTSDAAHELMTPLSSLRSDAEIMLRKPRSKEEYRETIQRMLTETRRMSEMVHLLLQLSRVESVHRAEAERVNISQITEVVIGEHQQKARDKDIAMEVDITPNLQIRAHHTYIKEVVNNLLENALKYTPEGGNVELQLQRSSSKAVLHLSDTGIGFDEETQKHLFERFYRANTQDVQGSPGSGLGLPLVKAIVELYDGKIRAYSDGQGEGGTFVVELPLVEEKRT